MSKQVVKIINEQKILGKDFRVYRSIEEPLFLAKDVAEWLNNKNTSQMIKDAEIDEDEKGIFLTDTLGGIQKQLFVTEDGLYELLMQSRKPVAKPLKKEIKSILKQLRKTGAVILEYASEESIDFEKRFGKYRIRKTFMNSKSIEADYKEFKELSQGEWKAKRLDNNDRIKLCNIICSALEERLKINMADMKGSEMLSLREAITDIKDDIIKLANKKHGGIKAGQTKEINRLEEQNDKLIDRYVKFVHKEIDKMKSR
ncbi:Bro-N domain-containing protein [Clostridium sp. C2-6-12]|uniref:BRO-N domain-containing protein n=1 Tax=Clostridium sp. C2-6-12 TaxID=2698832 RepID=UPI0013718F8E|nr:Bro-N domain-containing protein [Clostridium sp. C2-6-12]